jgi:hypothetical protein
MFKNSVSNESGHERYDKWIYKSPSKCFGFPLLLPFYQRLPLFFFMLRLSEEQASTWATTDKAILLKENIFCLHKQQQHVND